MFLVQKIKLIFLSIFIMGVVSACGGGSSSSDSGGQGSQGCSNPDLNASFNFVANSNSSDRFTATFRNNNTVSTDINGGTSGTWAYVGNPPSQIRFTIGSEAVTANIATPSNTDCRVVTITLRSPDDVDFTGTRR